MARRPKRPPSRPSGLAASLSDTSRTWIAIAAVALIFGELMLFGGDRREVALAFTFAYALGLAALLSFSAWAPRVLAAGRELWPAYALFAAAAAWVALQFTPFAQGMARDAWTAAGAPPAITIDRFATSVELLKLSGLGAVFVTGVAIGAGERRARAGFATWGLLGAAYAGWAMLGFYREGLGGGGVEAGRLSGSLLSPNTAAAVLALFATAGWTASLLAIRSAFEAGDLARERLTGALAKAWPWVSLAALSIWAIALTGSRGGLLSALAGFVAASTAVALAGGRRGAGTETRQTIAAVAGAALALAVLFGVSQAPLAARLGAYQVGVADRGAYIDLYLSHLHNLPWTGLGLGSFNRFNPLMLGSSAPAKFWEFGAMHNAYLQWVYEAGVAGAALMAACLIWVLAITVRGVRRRGAASPWPATSLGVSVMIASHAMIDFDIQIHAIAALWALVMGAGAGAALRDRG